MNHPRRHNTWKPLAILKKTLILELFNTILAGKKASKDKFDGPLKSAQHGNFGVKNHP